MKTLDPNNMPQTDEEAVQYLPDSDPLVFRACKGIYRCRRALGQSIIDSLAAALEAYINAGQKQGADSEVSTNA